jgi:FtsP/CotA-like multicopper oxidase with cupredoxin domain
MKERTNMSCKTFVKMWRMPALALAILAIAATPSFAQPVDLAAVTGEWTPPGGGASVAMWGFITDTGSCPVSPVTWTVGPTLTATAGGSLTVNVRNCLSEPVSVFIPGQLKATSPVTFTDGQGRTRVRSFDAETAAGGSGSYTWTGVKEGTYLYHSGTHPQVQVQMGLYGALTVGNYGIGNEATLVYSEIDPDLHAAVDDGTYGTTGPTSTFDYKPRYFLINGAAFPDTTDIAIGTGTDVLLRFVNAGLRTHVPTLEGGLYMDLIAEDGNLYPFPQTQYGVELSAAKTIDARLNAGTDGRYALYDRALNLTNGSATGGGMLTYIDAGPVIGAPTAVDDAYSTDEGVPLVVNAGDDPILPVGVLFNDLGGAASAVLVSGPSAGSLSGGLAADGSFTYTPNGNFNGTDVFTYRANDGLGGPDSNVAAVRITVNFVNDAPVAIDDFDTTPLNTAVTTDVVANDQDVDGNLDPTSVTVLTLPSSGFAVSNGDGTITYTPSTVGFGLVSFVYEVCDTGDDGLGTNALCDTATVNVTVEATPPANVPPFANDDFATTTRNTPVTFSVTANDVDPDGSIDVTTVVITTGASTQRNGTVVENGDGTVTFTPKKGFRGTDTFEYTVNDDAGVTSNEATVRVNVVKP